ncbi:MAG: cation diffusion facilitator family transporter [Acidimicrobiia bacterium]|nr:MAG: cation diffusion facilitator family transporter [Acidimicrobiia bacterium]
MSDGAQPDHGGERRSHGLWHRLVHLLSHDHDHGSAHKVLDAGAEGIRATKISLVGLGLTALLQALVVVLSGSVALASDTLHNLGDALTAIPLWIAFSLGRRSPTRSYTYGYHRAEDVAGVVIVLAIGASAALIIWESVQRLLEPRLIDYIPWVIAAGLIGAAGNELVARYRIRVGRRIGSEALVADGQHARTDALTSLTVVVAGIGAAFGAAWVDPVAGLVVALVILRLLFRSARSITRRLLDAVDPELVDGTEKIIAGVDGVLAVTDLRLRWHGHQLHVSACVAVDADLTVAAWPRNRSRSRTRTPPRLQLPGNHNDPHRPRGPDERPRRHRPPPALSRFHRTSIAQESAMGPSRTRNDAKRKCRLNRRFADLPWSVDTPDSGS